MSQAIKWILYICCISIGILLFSKIWIRVVIYKYSKIPTNRNIISEMFAGMILNMTVTQNIMIMSCPGILTDNFNPQTSTIQLSKNVYGQASIMAVAIAAHEVGHAIQHEEGYAGLKAQRITNPLTGLGIITTSILVLIALFTRDNTIINIAITLISITILTRAMLLPVEYDASRRALNVMSESGLFTKYELEYAHRVLRAAAFTYIASLFDVVLKVIIVMLALLLAGSNKKKT